MSSIQTPSRPGPNTASPEAISFGFRIRLGAMGMLPWSLLRPLLDWRATPDLFPLTFPLHALVVVGSISVLALPRRVWTPRNATLTALLIWSCQLSALTITYHQTHQPFALQGISLLIAAYGAISIRFWGLLLGLMVSTSSALVLLQLGENALNIAMSFSSSSLVSVILFIAFRSYAKQVAKGVTDLRAELASRKQAESEREQLRESFVQAQKMEAIGRLAGGIAHDINNILTGIAGLADYLRREVAGDLRPDLEEILAACARGGKLTKDLLGFARRGHFAMKSVDIASVIASVVRLLERTSPNGIEIRSNIGQHTSIRGDDAELSQALMNLGINGLDAMNGRGTLTISTAEVEVSGLNAERLSLAPDVYLTISVADTGTGMPPEIQARLFEPFFTTKPIGRGTGLGLAMVYGTTRAHGGAIQVETAPGQGTTMTLYLPIRTAESSCEEKTPINPATPSLNRSVLIVDDDPLIRRVSQRILEARGYHVVAVDQAEAGLEYLERGEAVDVVLLDMMMPGIGGMEGFKRMREMAPDLKILVASGFRAGRDVENCLELGALGFLPKPFKPDDLTKAIASALS